MTGKPRTAKPAAPAKPAPPLARRRKSAKQQERELDEQLAENLPAPVVFDPAYEAHKLHLAGVPWREAAAKCGYPTPAAAALAVAHYLQRAVSAIGAQQQQLALATQKERYEAVLREWWELGTKGHDEKAGRMVMAALAALDKIQRLTDPEVSISRETIVISPDRETYLRQLQEVVAEREAAKAAKPGA